MNDIKFRAWDKEDFKIRKVLGMSFEHGAISVELNNEKYLQDDASRFELMQYTGLKDKNGKEIYVGDIVQGGILRMTSGVEMYNSRTTVHFKGGMFKCGQSSLNSFNDRTEVVGNIYENPKLLGDNQ